MRTNRISPIALAAAAGALIGFSTAWGGYRPSAASNLIMYVILAYAFRELWRRMTRRRDRARAAAPVAPG